MLLAVALVMFLSFTGAALITQCLGDETEPRHYLAAPAVGLAVVAIPTLILHRVADLPIAQFANFLGLVLLIASIFVFAIFKKAQSAIRLWPFIAVGFGSLFIVGWPLLEFGPDWLSYANDDMTNYSLSAEHLIKDGFYTVPTMRDYLQERSGTASFFFYLHYERYAADAILAFVASVSRNKSFTVFMPTILSFNVALVMSAAFLVYRDSSTRIQAFVTSVFMMISPLTTLGTIYQLFAQVSGLAMVCASIGILAETFETPSSRLIGRSVLAGVTLAGAFEIYPEGVPFILAPLTIYTVVKIFRSRFHFKVNIVKIFIVGIVTTALVNLYFVNMYAVYVQRLMQTSRIADVGSPFPFYLIPSGFANLAGLTNVASYPGEPELSLTIAVGMVIFACTFIATILLMLRGSLVGSASLFCCLLAILFFWKHSDFALYKLAMYIQPFAIGTLADASFKVRWRRPSFSQKAVLG